MERPFYFERPLKEGVILKRNSRFTMEVLLNEEIVICHCPTTGRIGNIELKGVACLLSESDNPRRKLRYTVEAISCDSLERKTKNWIGINQILSNKLVAFFLETHQLDGMISHYKNIKREVNLRQSKLDFLVENVYIEVKTALTTLEVKYDKHIKTREIMAFSSTERFIKHITELAYSLKENEKAILLTVQQYEVTQPKPHQHSTHYEEVKRAVIQAISKGVEIWNITMRFLPTKVELLTCKNITQGIYDL